ncbi:hypothetical protein [Shewanella aestuarii]|uniref:Uncharacterized protein n=1 Tax=Shewanella aestuarii TaxID=1028752 RepID=A0A6G9QS44_9GAMM|nr:hypothetical protein [Shewanella aestuarii]QIR16601.1 hypothetical protein HBH39_19185 [Shewanella aestuarii]
MEKLKLDFDLASSDLDSLFESLAAIQLNFVGTNKSLFNYANNTEHFTFNCCLDLLSTRERSLLLKRFSNEFNQFIAHAGFVKLFFNSEFGMFGRLLYHLHHEGYEDTLSNTLLFYSTIDHQLDDRCANSLLSLSLVSQPYLAKLILSAPQLIAAPDLSKCISSILYRLTPDEVVDINCETLFLYTLCVNNLKETLLPFLLQHNLFPKLIRSSSDMHVTAKFTVEWCNLASAEPQDVILMLHSDIFQHHLHLHSFLIYLVDELFSQLSEVKAKQFLFEILCYCSAVYPDSHLQQLTALKDKLATLSSGQYKQLIRVCYYKGPESLSLLFHDEKRGHDHAA